MMYTRTDYTNFLEAEYNAQIKEYERLINTKASVLKELGKIFVGLFVGFKDEFALFKVRISNKMPLKNSYWTASCFIGKMGSYKNWGDHSWADLREQYQSGCSDAYCAWLSKSDDVSCCLIGIKNITVEFAEILSSQKPVIAFGPKDPPLRYLMNLKDICNDTSCAPVNAVLDFEQPSESVWTPKHVSSKEDLKPMILNEFENHDAIAIQGPPGTGKTFKMAGLIASLLKSNKSVLVTALTNEALRVLASKDDIKPYLSAGKVTKTSLTIDEKRALPSLEANNDNSCNATSGNLSLATFYIASSWAKTTWEVQPFDYVIVDEASQALLPMLAASRKLGKKVIWIGDQNQLAPIVQVNEDILASHGWSQIVKGFDTICNNFSLPSFMLTDTYRLTKRCANFTGLFYGNELNSVSEISTIDTKISELNTLGGPSLIDMELAIGDKKPDNAISTIYNLTQKILAETPKAKIAILAKFKETIEEIQKKFITLSESNQIPESVRIETVDKIQGMTVDFTIFFIPNASLGFSLDDGFFNVATSRAQYCTIIIADKKILKNYMSEEVRKYFLKLYDDKVATIEPEKTVLSVGDISVTVLGKITLPEKHLKEIVDDKENIFIVDTNVFVNCPNIISKIGKYKVVIPTTVLEELDHLKLKPGIDKKALNDAAKNINLAFQNKYSHMDAGDSNLLPSGFDAKKADCLILSVALKYKKENIHPILLTSDNMLQSKALGLGITTISLKEFLQERR